MTALAFRICETASMQIPRQNHTVDRDAFAQRLVYVREKLGLSKTEFATSLGLSKSNYGQVEAGNRMLTVDQIYKCFIVHGVPMEYLLAGQEARLPDHLRG
ncbi:helix-turn-helix domain-containing protein [Pseudooceanicola nitratireducens]|uniref:helix-turn-helix domain-containing protein n=1 Tax=Pseudooceanicola nitratireducens TaxID=517719 RepID=UPI003C7A8D83